MSDEATTTQTEAANSGEPTDGGGIQSGAAKFTQEQFDRALTERLSRQERAFEKKIADAQQAAIESFRAERGLDDDALAKLGTVDGELSTMKREYNKLKTSHSQVESKAEKMRSVLMQKLVDEAVLKAAAPKAANGDPEPILALLKQQGKIRVSEEDWSAYVADDKGEPSGMTIDDLVSELLVRKPQLAAAAGNYGAGSRPSRNGTRTDEQGADTPEGRMSRLRSVFGG